MSPTQPEAARTRATVYHALAEALAGPLPGTQRLVMEAVTAGAQKLGSPACRKAALALAELPETGVEGLRESYARVTNNRDGRPLMLYESIYRHGRLAGAATWEVEEQYRAVGLDAAGGELPDHASLELAFLGHLADAEAAAREAGDGPLVARLRAEQQRFLRNHAGAWLLEAGAALAAAEDPFYAVVGRLLGEFLTEELTGRKRNGKLATRLPALQDPAACTLCGLCVGSCPLGALRVVESATETTLTLDSSRCIGCDRCVRICPEEALILSTGTRVAGPGERADGSARRVLRRSPRATCPNCGQPTVSQAELDAVFARLQADAATQQRLSLCVECKSWSV